VVVTDPLANSDPGAVKEIYRVRSQGKKAAGLPKAGDIAFLPFGSRHAGPGCRPSSITRCSKASSREKSMSRSCFDDTTRALEG
jgi:hypothetical protein